MQLTAEKPDSGMFAVNIVPGSPPVPSTQTTHLGSNYVTPRPHLVLLDDQLQNSLKRGSLDGAGHSRDHSVHSKDYVQPGPRSAHPDSRPFTPRPASLAAGTIDAGPSAGDHGNTLAALSIGVSFCILHYTTQSILTFVIVQAPLIASVVVSCISAMRDEISAAFGDDIRSRPPSAQIIFALMWAATVTSLGSTMIAVAGLAMASGYHDSHVGITKTIIRKIRAWRRRLKKAPATQEPDVNQIRIPSPVPTVATIQKKERHALAALRAAEVSARVCIYSLVTSLWMDTD